MVKKLLLAVILMLSVFTTKAQDTVRIKHTNYTTVYSKSLEYPVIVEWWETKARVTCKTPLPRKDQFAPDPQLKDATNLGKSYVGAGVDRGHMCPAASSECDGAKVLTECFYFSNMAPQYHSLNAGDWKTLETYTREMAMKYDSVHVWAGSVGVAKKINGLSIPTKCWKVIYVKSTKSYEAYIFDNTADKPTGMAPHKVNVSDVTKLTGFKFN
jgi:endonuclease G